MKRSKSIIAIVLCLVMVFALAGCGKSKNVKSAEALIGKIGAVTVDSAEAVAAAESAFAALTEEEKSDVENAAILTEAREKLDILVTEELIDEIGEVTAESESAVVAAENAFAALPEQSRNSVANSAVLTEARAALDAALASKAILGTWLAESEQIDTLVATIDSSLGESTLSFADYLDSFPVPILFEAKEDGTYTLSCDRDRLGETFVKLREATVRFYDDFFLMTLREAFAEQGITVQTWEEVESFLNASKDDIFQNSMGMSLSEFVDSLLGDEMMDGLVDPLTQEGQFSVEDGKIFFSESVDEEPGQHSYQEIELNGDTLTFTDHVGDDFFSDLEYPIVFQRQN